VLFYQELYIPFDEKCQNILELINKDNLKSNPLTRIIADFRDAQSIQPIKYNKERHSKEIIYGLLTPVSWDEYPTYAHPAYHLSLRIFDSRTNTYEFGKLLEKTHNNVKELHHILYQENLGTSWCHLSEQKLPITLANPDKYRW